MVPLLALSVISLVLILERSVFWLVLHRPERLSRHIPKLLPSLVSRMR